MVPADAAPLQSMKVVILAGGQGSRLAEETATRPKPLVEIGGRPILWHIMKIYHSFGCTDFVICLGYKGYMIKEYFANYFLHMSNVTIDLARNSIDVHDNESEPWRVTLVDTGEHAMTGGRLLAVRRHLGNDDFCFTYGDGVADIDIARLVACHRTHGKPATVSAVRPAGRFGALTLDGSAVRGFDEKPDGDGGWINGGFFVLSPSVLDYIDDAATIWEGAPMTRLVREGKLNAYPHDGFWHAMDTLRDRERLQQLWASGQAPWKLWA